MKPCVASPSFASGSFSYIVQKDASTPGIYFLLKNLDFIINAHICLYTDRLISNLLFYKEYIMYDPNDRPLVTTKPEQNKALLAIAPAANTALAAANPVGGLLIQLDNNGHY